MTGIKAQSDGKPACFNQAKDTNIPQLCTHVTKTTALRREASAKALVTAGSDLVNSALLYVGDSGNSSEVSLLTLLMFACVLIVMLRTVLVDALLIVLSRVFVVHLAACRCIRLPADLYLTDSICAAKTQR